MNSLDGSALRMPARNVSKCRHRMSAKQLWNDHTLTPQARDVEGIHEAARLTWNAGLVLLQVPGVFAVHEKCVRV